MEQTSVSVDSTQPSGQPATAPRPELRERASIHDCEALAISSGAYDRATFDLVGPLGRIGARWLDAHMGLIEIDGQDGFLMSRDFDSPLIRCENFAIPEKD